MCLEQMAVRAEAPGKERTVRNAETDTIVAQKILRRLRRAALGDVRRCSNDDDVQLGADPRRDHVLLDALTWPYSGVKTLSDNVCLLAINTDVEIDLGIKREKARNYRR